MSKLKLRQLINGILRGALLVLVAYALFIPFFGPLMDHHFAERQLNHAHVYLGEVNQDHLHPFEAAHNHSSAGHDHQAASRDTAPDDIVYLTSNDGLSQGVPQITTASAHVAAQFPNPEEHNSTLNTPEDAVHYDDALLALPKKPPRV